MRLKHNGKADIIIVDNQVICFKRFKNYVPVLRIVHQYPEIGKKFQVDKGAIRFILNGANIMCQGFNSEGGNLVDAEKGEIIIIKAEGKEHALAIGELMKSSAEIKEENQGIGVQNLHCLNDDLWNLKTFKKEMKEKKDKNEKKVKQPGKGKMSKMARMMQRNK